jgi:chitin-binding protein
VSSSRSSSSSSVGGRCTSPVYANSGNYATGALAQNIGNEYRCTVGGWCTVGGPYAPGVGWAWTNAWTLVQSCQ